MCRQRLKPLECRLRLCAYKHNSGPPRQSVMCICFQPSIKREEKSFCTHPQNLSGFASNNNCDQNLDTALLSLLHFLLIQLSTSLSGSKFQVFSSCGLARYSWGLSAVQLQIKPNLSIQCKIHNHISYFLSHPCPVCHFLFPLNFLF